ncbi:MAG: hypothetical protein BMS9Abin36_1245 [Gammaproteobacteria bacterium]|nr:MAG: hypothetical protein BMS9Abin36_1245 [Gammaproteobacteria bacterium]
MTESILNLRKYGIAFGDKIILSSVNLSVADRGVFVLLGPAGTGKSTLLRTLAGFNDAHPSLRHWGEALYLGESLEIAGRPSLVSQNARLLMASVLENIINDMPERHTLTKLQQLDVAARLLEHAGLRHLLDRLDESAVQLSLAEQRHLAIARISAANPRLLCIDEPTTGLSEKESETLLEYVQTEAESRAVLVVLHNQMQAKMLGGFTALLAGGWVQEQARTSEFFSAPVSQSAKDFVRSGSCCVPFPNATADELEMEQTPAPPKLPEEAIKYASDAFGPRGFLWVKKGQLAGTPRPGIVSELKYDLKALQRVGVTRLICLQEQKPVDPSMLSDYAITGMAMPIPDMGAPTVTVALNLCEQIAQLMSNGEVVAVHCKAGIGRTGTILTSQLIWEGMKALDALEKVRRIEPRWVQSEEQVAFLEEFETVVSNCNQIQQSA